MATLSREPQSKLRYHAAQMVFTSVWTKVSDTIPVELSAPVLTLRDSIIEAQPILNLFERMFLISALLCSCFIILRYVGSAQTGLDERLLTTLGCSPCLPEWQVHAGRATVESNFHSGEKSCKRIFLFCVRQDSMVHGVVHHIPEEHLPAFLLSSQRALNRAGRWCPRFFGNVWAVQASRPETGRYSGHLTKFRCLWRTQCRLFPHQQDVAIGLLYIYPIGSWLICIASCTTSWTVRRHCLPAVRQPQSPEVWSSTGDGSWSTRNSRMQLLWCTP